MATPINNSVVKAFDILRVFTDTETELNAREIAQRAGINTATAHRFLVTLENVGALTRASGKKFQLGMLLVELAGRVSVHKALVQLIQPHMAQIVKQVRETCHLGVLNNGEVLYIAKEESEYSLRINTYIGKRIPAYCTALGRTLLADMDAPLVDQYFNNTHIKTLTSHTETSIAALKRIIEKVRNDGYAVDREESEPGLCCVGVPIYNKRGQVQAAVSVSAPLTRIEGSALMDTRDVLLKHADIIRSQLD